MSLDFLGNTAQFIQNQPLLAYLAVFVGGIVSSSSPCVLVTIPLVIGFVGGYSEGDRRKAFLFSAVFIVGLSLTFTALGAIAGILGTLFGDVGKGWYFLAAGVAVLVGLQLMGVFNFQLPVPRNLQPKRRGLIGALLLGLLFGAVSSPCATPVLAAILAFVATQGSIAYGASLLFAYALGHCVLILAAGTFTGFAESYLASRGVANFSAWMKKVSGALILGAGGYVAYVTWGP
ncbi:MAG: cytochrome c biogenesis protein CcdA [Pseudomonadota bacterium]